MGTKEQKQQAAHTTIFLVENASMICFAHLRSKQQHDGIGQLCAEDLQMSQKRSSSPTMKELFVAKYMTSEELELLECTFRPNLTASRTSLSTSGFLTNKSSAKKKKRENSASLQGQYAVY